MHTAFRARSVLVVVVAVVSLGACGNMFPVPGRRRPTAGAEAQHRSVRTTQPAAGGHRAERVGHPVQPGQAVVGAERQRRVHDAELPDRVRRVLLPDGLDGSCVVRVRHLRAQRASTRASSSVAS
jgi:hypothetical protein